MAADEEIALIIVFVNFCSAIWSYFCITASLDRRNRAYDVIHDSELAWHAFWSSCQTFAILVSITNVALVIYVTIRTFGSFMERLKSTQGISRKAVIGFCGVAALLLLLPASFIPYNLTRINTDRLDENIFIHCEFFFFLRLFFLLCFIRAAFCVRCKDDQVLMVAKGMVRYG
ncbi:hypothetical protein P167DRAFT_308736 [Morchella conica CCBAS932]|uniref:Uncharacterized protein n=1 Tax=Morchella conica CCBAS932 TaxID=1392247 RepID=A0A3N4KIY6_9PEZI|nr:hypothetical protein P167DRAFT_308736 [Morchella conica CCBAS932]